MINIEEKILKDREDKVKMKKVNSNPNRLSKKASWSFAFGGLGYLLYQGLFATYHAPFLTDVVGISTAAVGTLMIVARIWDAFNDPIIGYMVDKSKFGNQGKFKKFILATAVPLAFFALLCFTNLGLGPVGNLIVAYIAYIGYGMVYTVFETSYWGLSSNMTYDVDERSKLMSKTKTLQFFGLLPGIILLPLIALFGKGNDSKGYFISVLIIAVMGAIFTLLPGLVVKEKQLVLGNTESNKKASIKDFAKIVTKNRPLLMLVIAYIPLLLSGLSQSLTIYFFKNNMQRPDLVPVYMLLSLIAMVVGASVSPMVLRLLKGTKRASIICAIIAGILNVSMYFIGYGNVWLVVALRVILTLFGTGIAFVFLQIMFAECIDYQEWKFQERNEATIFAIKSFAEKVRFTASGIGIFLIGAFGYVPNQVQTPQALAGIWILYTLINGIGWLLYALTLKAYPITHILQLEMMTELNAKREVKE